MVLHFQCTALTLFTVFIWLCTLVLHNNNTNHTRSADVVHLRPHIADGFHVVGDATLLQEPRLRKNATNGPHRGGIHGFPLPTLGNTTRIPDTTSLTRRTRVVLRRAFDHYIDFAFPLDELDPLQCSGIGTGDGSNDEHDHNTILGGYMLTLVDSLGTLAIAGEQARFEDAVRRVINGLSFNLPSTVQLFESTIRILGGLLSAHMLATEDVAHSKIHGYNGELLVLAQALGDKLITNFHTKSGIPLQYTEMKDGSPEVDSGNTCTACAGSLFMEFGMLSHLTGNYTYYGAARRAVIAVWNSRSRLDLLPRHINPDNGVWNDAIGTVGAGVDSFYEYLLKGGILFNDPKLMAMFRTSYSAIMQYMRDSSGSIFRNINVHTGNLIDWRIDALSAFFPGMQVLAGDVATAAKQYEVYKELWDRFSGMPEVFDTYDATVEDPQYHSRPEFIESTYYLYQATKDPMYLRVGERVLYDIETRLRSRCGYSGLKNVVTGEKSRRMESFFISETLKYLILLFDVDNPINKIDSNIVFTTEGHPLWTKGVVERQYENLFTTVKANFTVKNNVVDTESFVKGYDGVLKYFDFENNGVCSADEEDGPRNVHLRYGNHLKFPFVEKRSQKVLDYVANSGKIHIIPKKRSRLGELLSDLTGNYVFNRRMKVVSERLPKALMGTYYHDPRSGYDVLADECIGGSYAAYLSGQFYSIDRGSLVIFDAYQHALDKMSYSTRIFDRLVHEVNPTSLTFPESLTRLIVRNSDVIDLSTETNLLYSTRNLARSREKSITSFLDCKFSSKGPFSVDMGCDSNLVDFMYEASAPYFISETKGRESSYVDTYGKRKILIDYFRKEYVEFGYTAGYQTLSTFVLTPSSYVYDNESFSSSDINREFSTTVIESTRDLVISDLRDSSLKLEGSHHDLMLTGLGFFRIRPADIVVMPRDAQQLVDGVHNSTYIRKAILFKRLESYKEGVNETDYSYIPFSRQVIYLELDHLSGECISGVVAHFGALMPKLVPELFTSTEFFGLRGMKKIVGRGVNIDIEIALKCNKDGCNNRKHDFSNMLTRLFRSETLVNALSKADEVRFSKEMWAGPTKALEQMEVLKFLLNIYSTHSNIGEFYPALERSLIEVMRLLKIIVKKGELAMDYSSNPEKAGVIIQHLTTMKSVSDVNRVLKSLRDFTEADSEKFELIPHATHAIYESGGFLRSNAGNIYREHSLLSEDDGFPEVEYLTEQQARSMSSILSKGTARKLLEGKWSEVWDSLDTFCTVKYEDRKSNRYRGRFVLVKRGECSFHRKALNVQILLGTGLIIVDDESSPHSFDFPVQAGLDTDIRIVPVDRTGVTIPVITVSIHAAKRILYFLNKQNMIDDSVKIAKDKSELPILRHVTLKESESTFLTSKTNLHPEHLKIRGIKVANVRLADAITVEYQSSHTEFDNYLITTEAGSVRHIFKGTHSSPSSLLYFGQSLFCFFKELLMSSSDDTCCA